MIDEVVSAGNRAEFPFMGSQDGDQAAIAPFGERLRPGRGRGHPSQRRCVDHHRMRDSKNRRIGRHTREPGPDHRCRGSLTRDSTHHHIGKARLDRGEFGTDMLHQASPAEPSRTRDQHPRTRIVRRPCVNHHDTAGVLVIMGSR